MPVDHEPLLTVAELLDVPQLRLRLIAGQRGVRRPVRWAHSIDLLDPRPYLRGEEFILTLGSQLMEPEACRTFVEAVLQRDASGIGFGVGNYHSEIPTALSAICEARGLPLVEVPVDVPFLAIIEFLAERRADRRSEEVRRLRHREGRLLSAVENGQGLDGIARILSREFDAGFLVTNLTGDILAIAAPGHVAPRAEACVSAAGLGGRLPSGVVRAAVDGVAGAFVPIRYHQRPLGWIAWLARDGKISGALLQVLHEVAPLVALQLDARRAAQEQERRAIGSLLGMVMNGVADPIALRAAADGSDIFDGLLVASAWAVDDLSTVPALPERAIVGELGPEILVVSDSSLDLMSLASTLRMKVGIGSSVALSEIGRSLREARAAVQLTRLGRPVATWQDLVTLDSLLEQVPPDRTMAFATQLIVPLVREGHGSSERLVDTLRAFLDTDGRADEAAERLGIHANSVRHRLHKIRLLSGKDPFNFADRATLYIGLWAWDRQVLGPEKGRRSERSSGHDRAPSTDHSSEALR